MSAHRMKALGLAVVGGMAGVFPSQAPAGVVTFLKGTAWNSLVNWSSGLKPRAGDALLFQDYVPSGTTLGANHAADTLSFNTANTMTINSVPSGTTGWQLTLNSTAANANGTSDMVSMKGGGTINFGTVANTGTVWLTLGTASGTINVEDGSALVFGPYASIHGTNTQVLSFNGNSTGTLTLAAPSTYSGGTTIASGTLAAGYTTKSPTASSTGIGAVRLTGGTLASSGGATSYVLGAVSSTAGTIAPGGDGTTGELDLGSTLGLDSGGALTLKLDVNGANADLLKIAGVFTPGASPTLVVSARSPSLPSYTLISAAGGLSSIIGLPAAPTGYEWAQTDTSIGLLRSVPEPAAMASAAAVSLGLAGRRRRKA